MESVIVAVIIFAIVFIFGLAIGSSKKNMRVMVPNVSLPTNIVKPASGLVNYTEEVPWLNSVVRSELLCRREKICDQQKAYVATLPDTPFNTWYLKTDEMFVTDYYLKYPVATILIVPKGPESRRFIIDNNFRGYGLRPTIKEDGSNYIVNKQGEGLNITGDFPHSFVIKNEADHDILFAREAFDGEIADGTDIDYWTLKPGSITLMWPANRYWYSIQNGTKRYWNATQLPTQDSSIGLEHAAYLAETMMFDVLANEAPEAP